MLGTLLTGCASTQSQKVDVSRFIESWEARTVKEAQAADADRGRDAPDAPSAALPGAADAALPPPDGGMVPPVGTSELTIQPDCLLQISVAEDPGLDGSYPVNDIGAVQLGYVGPVLLYNRTEHQAERKIMDVLKYRDFKNATVKVRILRASYDKVNVAGVVHRPGLVQIGAGDSISLTEALLRAGGLKTPAQKSRVRVIRGGVLSPVAFDLQGEEYPLVSNEGKPDIPFVLLRNNDLVFVYNPAERSVERMPGRSITLLGEVSRPGVYTFAPGEPATLMHLLFKLGGLPPYANRRNIKIIRRMEDGQDQETRVNAEQILKDGNPDKDVQLEEGDRIVVPARRLTFF